MVKSIKTACCLLALCLSLVLFCSTSNDNLSTQYYFNAELGDNGNLGISPNQAWQSLIMLDGLKLKPGDSILIASGQVFEYPLLLKNMIGTKKKPVVVTTYGGTDPAQIKTKGHLNAVLIENSSWTELNNLSISASKGYKELSADQKAMRCGVLVKASSPGDYQHIYLKNISVYDVFYEDSSYERPSREVRTPNGTQSYGWGIRVINNNHDAKISDVRIDSCHIENVSHTGIKLTSRRKESDYGIVDFQISGNSVVRTGGPGIQMSGVQNGHIFGNLVDQSGSNDDSRKWGRGSGLWTWGSDRVLIEKNRFTNANGPADSAGAHIDYNCSNILLQYNFSANNAGGFCEILGNNYNCAYRYNISVNDGHRIKGQNGAFQEGKIFWLSGYNSEKRKGPYNSYFYNNTIYVKEDIQAKIAIDRVADGILIANNIFHILGESIVVKGDQYNPETEGEWNVSDVLFENNLFLKKSSWPEEQWLQDQSPLYGNSLFANMGGLKPEDYIPQHVTLVKDKGIPIQKLAKDSIGLVFGLKVKRDILGNEIKNVPDLGAIEIE